MIGPVNVNYSAYLTLLLQLSEAQGHNSKMNTDPWVIRTGKFADSYWKNICSQISQLQTVNLFLAYVQFVDDRRYLGKSVGELVRMLPDEYPNAFCFVVDDSTFTSAEDAIAVVSFLPDWNDELDGFDWKPHGQIDDNQIRQFRALPSAIQRIQNNLSLANMGFEDFANYVDEDGVFRK